MIVKYFLAKHGESVLGGLEGSERVESFMVLPTNGLARSVIRSLH